MKSKVIGMGLALLMAVAGPVWAGTNGKVSVEGENGSLSIEFGQQGSGAAQGGGQQSGAADIPPGHMPPPGKCRIWYHGRPPGQQPAPDSCNKLRGRVPDGATLVRG